MFHPYSQISLDDATHQSMLLVLVMHLNLISPQIHCTQNQQPH